ncbi:MAG: pirin family protein [Ardenticatenaceae bacterium]|nr:pirin family protein [Ardenticatenaceae bacterium]MCB8947746.1 pirin family protein [Ardenticatenaceae bacterium]
MNTMFESVINNLTIDADLQFHKANTFPTIRPVHWLKSHFAVGGMSPLQRLSGMLTAHMTQIAPHNGFRWHPHRGLEIFTYVIDGELYHEDTTGGQGAITAGEVQRMFSGNFIQHQELNLTDEFTRVIQIWFVADVEHMGLPPHYEQTKLSSMTTRSVGDAIVRDIIGPNGATDAHVSARLTSSILPAGGSATVELPQPGEDLFLYFVDGNGRFQSPTQQNKIDIYDVVLATPEAETAVITAGDKPLNYLSFYLKPFMQN